MGTCLSTKVLMQIDDLSRGTGASLLAGMTLPVDNVIEAVALNGFVAQLPPDLLLNRNESKAVAWLAIEPADRPWPPIPGKDLSAGPFYIVWTGAKVASIRSDWIKRRRVSAGRSAAWANCFWRASNGPLNRSLNSSIRCWRTASGAPARPDIDAAHAHVRRTASTANEPKRLLIRTWAAL